MAGSRWWPGACWDWGGRGPPRAPRPLLLTLVLGVRSGTWRSRLPGASRGSGPSAGGLGDTPGLSGLHLGPMLLSVPTLRAPPPRLYHVHTGTHQSLGGSAFLIFFFSFLLLGLNPNPGRTFFCTLPCAFSLASSTYPKCLPTYVS